MTRLRPLPRLSAIETRAVVPPPKQADPFYTSAPWRALMTRLIASRVRRCEADGCGRTHGADGRPIRVFGDHIIELRDGGAPLDESNVQLLCGACHTAKTARARTARAGKVWSAP